MGVSLMLFAGEVLLFYKRFDRSIHIESLDPICVKKFRPVSSEIL